MPLPGVPSPEERAARQAKEAANIAAKKAAKDKNAADIAALIEKQGGVAAMDEYKRKCDEAVRRMGEDRRNRAYDRNNDDESNRMDGQRGQAKPAGFKSGDDPTGA